MKKDFALPEVREVYIAAVRRPHPEDATATEWWVYLINNLPHPIEHLIINSRGYSDLDQKNGQQTSTLRRRLPVVPAKSAVAIEPIMPEVFHLFNEYWVSFFEENAMKDRQYIFGPHSIDARFAEALPVLLDKGVLIR